MNLCGKVLPNRLHVVLTRNKKYFVENENVKVLHDISELNSYINSEEEAFVIGGEEIYRILMPYCKKMYITEINKEFEGDAYFPQFDERKWKKIKEIPGILDEKNNIDYKFVTYIKVN